MLVFPVVALLLQTSPAPVVQQCEGANTALDMLRCFERVLGERTDSLKRVEAGVADTLGRAAVPRLQQASQAWSLYGLTTSSTQPAQLRYGRTSRQNSPGN